ncbi:MAG: ThuA domain-containing protein [Planctomycetes bacterium]|nr:ThuA domain-containing protein [Planctomycetota bacterium]
MDNKIQVTIWNEGRHEKLHEAVRNVYPNGIHGALADGLQQDPRIICRFAALDEPEHGLSQKMLDDTDVLIWWSHLAHREVEDAVVDRVQARVLAGMGLIALHSTHYSKIFKRLMGTGCSLRWRVAGERERLWNIEPGHPITEGIGEYIELPRTEMYGERFDIPTPDRVVFISWFEGGEVFRSGCCFQRGHGRIFYFRPGHEIYPIYFHDEVRKVLINAVHWARPRVILPDQGAPKVKPLENLGR